MRVNSENPAPNAQLVAAKIFYFALVGGLSAFSVVVFVMSQQAESIESTNESLINILVWVAAALSLTLAIPSGSFAALMFFRDSEVVAAESTEARLKRYVSAKIMAAALTEGPGMLWCVIGLLSKQPVYLMGAALSIVILLIQFPRAAEVEERTGVEV